MHSSTLSSDQKNEAEILLSIASLVTEGRIREKSDLKNKKVCKGSYCDSVTNQKFNSSESFNSKYDLIKEQVFKLWTQNIPICVEVVLTCGCQEGDTFIGTKNCILLETWTFTLTNKRIDRTTSTFRLSQLVSAIRSQLYFSQITAWLISQDVHLTDKNLRYRFTIPGESFKTAKFITNAIEHTFPSTEIGLNRVLNVSFSSIPRSSKFPSLHCPLCEQANHNVTEEGVNSILDDRMQMFCTLNGKHHCEDFEEVEQANKLEKIKFKRVRQNYKDEHAASTSSTVHNLIDNNLAREQEDKSKTLLEAIERVGLGGSPPKCQCDKNICDTSSINKFNIKYCDNFSKKRPTNRRLTFDNEASDKKIPSALEQAKFRKNLDNAASMVFHSRTGLPLTSSPAPVRKGKTCFDYDSSINSVSAIKNALFCSSFSTDDDSESDVSPCSPETAHKVQIEDDPPIEFKNRRKGHDSSLLGSFEESVLNGRLEPVSTVQGFKAELGASGSFVPKHSVIPVTVFFYTLGDNDKISSPYLCHINLGKKGYYVPKRGTVQVTLFNPLGTVVKMFVIMYDLTDMPANSQTFIRQRTLYMPNNCCDRNIESGPKWLKYLIHLRFSSSKSGKIYLNKDIRMIILHKSDLDTATAHSIDLCYELRSFTIMPTNPRFSPRK